MGSVLPVLIATPRRSPRQRNLLWAAAGLSVLASMVALPAVQHLLALLHGAPHWPLLESLLARAPALAAWLMLCTMVAAPAWLLFAVMGRGMAYSVPMALALMAAALVGWVHLPSDAQCLPALSTPAGAVCALPPLLLAWGVGTALAMGLFGAAVLALRALGWVRRASRQDAGFEWDRYGL